jgi:uncharacterized protein
MGQLLVRSATDAFRPRDVGGEGIELLILQPSPFCNINCDYCYLPNRNSHKRLPLETLDTIIEQVFSAGLVQGTLSIVWHAGEPLTVPIEYYQEAFARIRELPVPHQRIQHSLQTNGLLLNEGWCRLFREEQVRVGVSIDGPASIHDRHRRDRRGLGTHARVMKGVECLREGDLPFHAIAVLSAYSLDFPDAIFNFFLANKIERVGFNIEEIEGSHGCSTLSDPGAVDKLPRFMRRVYELQRRSRGAVKIREFERAFQAIALAPIEGGTVPNSQVRPFGIVSVDCDGNVSTFSPELLGVKSSKYGGFNFGNLAAHQLLQITADKQYVQVAADIAAGVAMCAKRCEYYQFCGGGAPSNKYFENGTFVSSDTMYCQHTIKLPLDIVLSDLEDTLADGRATSFPKSCC